MPDKAKNTHKNGQKRTVLALCCLGVIAAAILAYSHFYRIPWNRFTVQIGQGAAESPDGNYRFEVRVCPVEFVPEDTDPLAYVCEEKQSAYVVGELWRDPVVDDKGVKQWDGKNSRVIYFDQFDFSPIEFYWIDDHTLSINGTVLSIPTEVFDYRRSF